MEKEISWIPFDVGMPPTSGQEIEVMIAGQVYDAVYTQRNGFLVNEVYINKVEKWRPKKHTKGSQSL